MASWKRFFSRTARGSRGLGVGVTIALAGAALLAPGGCALDRQGLSAGGGGSASSTTTTGATMSSASSSATTSTGTCTSGTGCGGCVIDDDCGLPTNDGCTVSTCVASVCTPMDTMGMAAQTQKANDCKKNVCGADGKPMPVNDPTDLPPDDNNACTDQTCTAGMPTFPPVPAGTACMNGTCDDKGNCFQCNKDMDCKGLTAKCDVPNHSCSACDDGMKNGKETGLDCGGDCKACVGDPCKMPMDCVGGNCADKICCDVACGNACEACNLAGSVGKCTKVPAGQTDPMTCDAPPDACNGMGACKSAAGIACATDADCGSGTCLGKLCRTQTGGACMKDLTCASGLCVNMKCADCSAGADCAAMMCGAPTCKAPGGSACDVDSDCAGNKCQFGLCIVDNGSDCAVAADCRSGVCTMGKCAACTAAPATCSPGASCGSTAFGVMGLICNRPPGAYCSSNLQCEGLKPCKGFPPTCQ